MAESLQTHMHPSMSKTTIQVLKHLKDIFQEAAKENKFANVKITSTPQPEQIIQQKLKPTRVLYEPHEQISGEAPHPPRVEAARPPMMEDIPFEEEEPQQLIVTCPAVVFVASPETAPTTP